MAGSTDVGGREGRKSFPRSRRITRLALWRTAGPRSYCWVALLGFGVSVFYVSVVVIKYT